MSRLYKNNAATVLNGSITSGQTSITILNGSAFPPITGSDTFFLTLENVAGTAWEIVLVTAHSNGGTALTVVRGQDGTSPAAWPDATLIERRVVAQEYGEFVSESDAVVNLQGDLNIAGDLTIGGGGAIGVPSGGTGLTTLTSGAILRGAGTSDVNDSLSPGTSGDVVATTDGNAWTSTPITTMVTKSVVENALATPLTVPFGGTGATTFPSGEILVGGGTGPITTISAGAIATLTSTYFLREVYAYDTAGVYVYYPTPNCYYMAYIKGGGGGGGGNAGGPDTLAIGTGGSGGEGGVVTVLSALQGETPAGVNITVGAAGVGGTGGSAYNTGGSGGTGGSSILGSATANGGVGGSGAPGGGSLGADGGDGADGTYSGGTTVPNSGDLVPAPKSVNSIWGPSNGGGSVGGLGGSGVTGFSIGNPGSAGTAGSVLIYEYY